VLSTVKGERAMSEGIRAVLTSIFPLTDEQAMWRVQMYDDPQAFARILQRWEGPIQRLCTRITGYPHRGEDLAQEAFAKIYAKREQYKPGGKFSTFLWRLALNLCYDELRRLKRRRESPLTVDDEEHEPGERSFLSSEPTPDSSLVQEERAALVREALAKLPESYRTVLVLRHYQDLKFREIADVLEIPEGTVKSRMAEGLTQLNQLLHKNKDRDLWNHKPTRRPEALML